MSWMFSKTQSDIGTMYAKNVTARQKADLDFELTSLQKNLAAKRISLDRLQPVLGELRDAMIDNVVTSDETNKLIAAFRAVNTTAGAHPPK
jgi:endonuclease/exonuclease/phosphatase (EEP) superfamily protein YafD